MAALSPGGTFSWFQQISQLPLARQLTFLIGLAASIALGMGVIAWSQNSDMAPLYGDLSLQDSQEIILQLEQSGVKYEVNSGSGSISVPSGQLHQVRMQLAGSGLPSGDGQGYEMLYQPQELGISSFMERARYDRALEEELARSISSLDGVKTTRVHLAIPENSGFIRDRGIPEASVLIGLVAGRNLSEQQIAGIRYIVSSSVPELQVDNVSVVDGQGRLLSNMDQANGMSFGQDQFNVTRQLEQHYVDRILELLTPLIGRNGVRAQVAAELDFTSIETTSEIYSPESAVRSELIVTERNGSASSAGGVPGTLVSLPPEDVTLVATAPAQPDEAQQESGITSSSETRNFELDKTISHIREASGTLQRLSVAVVVDYRESIDEAGEVVRLPLAPEELARMDALIRETVGFNEARGDSLNLVNASFIPPVEIEPLPEPSFLEQAWLWQAIRLTIAATLMLLLFFALVRPLLKAGQVSAKDNAAAQGESGEASAAPPLALAQVQVQAPDMRMVGDDTVTLGGTPQQAMPLTMPLYQQQLAVARTLVDEQPERVAQVVRNWVATDA